MKYTRCRKKFPGKCFSEDLPAARVIVTRFYYSDESAGALPLTRRRAAHPTVPKESRWLPLRFMTRPLLR